MRPDGRLSLTFATIAGRAYRVLYKDDNTGEAQAFAAALGLFALGLTAKPMLVTLPLTLILLDVWPLGRIERGAAWGRLLGEKLAIVDPARRFTLIESTGKKCRFLEHVREARKAGFNKVFIETRVKQN